MKLYVLSDLHNEFSVFDPPSTQADLVILAGDIHTRARGVKWANARFEKDVIYVCGNHEFYSGHIDQTLRKMRDQARPNIHVLENQTWVQGKTRFICATGWTDFSSTGDVVAASSICWEWMNDFRMIRADASYRRLRPSDVIERNAASYDFLSLELSKPFSGSTVVVTHHCPIPEVSGDKHEGHLSAAYFNRWHALLEQANLWVFGHTHRAVDIELNGCRVLSNPRGYPQEKTGFIEDFVVEI